MIIQLLLIWIKLQALGIWSSNTILVQAVIHETETNFTLISSTEHDWNNRKRAARVIETSSGHFSHKSASTWQSATHSKCIKSISQSHNQNSLNNELNRIKLNTNNVWVPEISYFDGSESRSSWVAPHKTSILNYSLICITILNKWTNKGSDEGEKFFRFQSNHRHLQNKKTCHRRSRTKPTVEQVELVGFWGKSFRLRNVCESNFFCFVCESFGNEFLQLFPAVWRNLKFWYLKVCGLIDS